MPEALIDTDVLYKATIYGLLSRLLNSEILSTTGYGILGAAKYMISSRLKKSPPSRGVDVAIADFNAVIATTVEIEPSNEEIRLAAALEYSARQLNLELDGGESLLCAVLIKRNSKYIFTGDKRAICAISMLVAQDASLPLAEKIVCLEQLFKLFIQKDGKDIVREAVCSEPMADKTLTNCFSCHSIAATSESLVEGLESYIRDLQKRAPKTLAVII